MEVTDEILKKETNTEKQEEIEMLQEFERRRKFKAAFDTFDKTEEENKALHPEDRLHPKEKQKEETNDQIEEILKADEEAGELFDSKKFTLIFLDAGMVCNMTRLNRVYERRILLYMGNKEGMIAYGIGRGPLYQEAYTDAYKQMRKNLIVIDHDPNFTCPADLKAKFNDFRLYIKSKYDPKMWGNPIMALMLRYAGLYHCEFVIKSRLKEPYAMVFAFFKAVTRNTTPLHMSEIFGTKNYRQYLGRPRRYEGSLFDHDNRA
jgi:ribosomal protein S5